MKSTLCLLALVAAVAAQPNVSPTLGTPGPRQFDFWVGEWDVANWWWRDGGKWVKGGDATCKAYGILDGAAVIEHWQGYAGSSFRYGYSVRAFDPDKKRWVLVLNWPALPDRTGFGTLEGTFTHGRGRFYSSFKTSDGKDGESRYSFSDISREKLRWDSATTRDGRRTWHTDWIMRFTRRPTDAPPLPNGPSSENKLSTLNVAREFDFLKGEFQGNGRVLAKDGTWQATSASARGEVILEGLAVQAFLDVGTQKHYGVAAWDGRVRSWVRYGLSKARPVFEVSRGGKSTEGMTLTVSADGERKAAWIWTSITESGFSVARHERDEDGKLRPVMTASLKRQK